MHNVYSKKGNLIPTIYCGYVDPINKMFAGIVGLQLEVLEPVDTHPLLLGCFIWSKTLKIIWSIVFLCKGETLNAIFFYVVKSDKCKQTLISTDFFICILNAIWTWSPLKVFMQHNISSNVFFHQVNKYSKEDGQDSNYH